MDGAEAATSASAPDLCGETLGWGLASSKIKKYAPVTRGSQGRELAALKKFDVPSTVDPSTPATAVLESPSVLA